MKRVAVIGGGITGVSIGRVLSNIAEVVLYEQEQTCGGLIRCDRVQDILYHRVGGHVFNAESERVKEWVRQLVDFDKELLFRKRNAKILFGESVVGYPIENHLYELPEALVAMVVNEFFELPDKPDQSSFDSFLRTAFGSTLYEIYFRPYNDKIWKQPLDTIPLSWLDGKLPMPQKRDVILNNIFRKGEKRMVHSTFYYPKEGGSQFWIDRISQVLNVVPQARIEKIQIDTKRKLRIGEEGRLYDYVVFTGDIRRFPHLSGVNDPGLDRALQACRNLRTRGVSNVLCECDQNDLTWLYIPEPSFNCHRVIYTGNFSSTNSRGTSPGRSSCVVEFEYGVDDQVIDRDLARLPGKLRRVESNEARDAYIVQEPDTRERIDTIKQCLQRHGVFLAGRFAEWEYYNMDKCIERALALKDFLE